ncbi:MAG: family 20 glycosylhydrolase [Chthoniobacterales bacterium]
MTPKALPIGDTPLAIAHLDLKGVLHRPQHTLGFLEEISHLGYNTLLVEYEDIFPYKDAVFAIEEKEAWTEDFLKQFLARAAELKIEIIPLQQTLGHLEYAFRWERFRKYCMPHGFPSTLNIGSDEAKAWVRELLLEVIQAHKNSRFIHLGMDEARSLALYAEAQRVDPLALFLDYLEELCLLCKEYGKTPLIWSDMLEDHISAGNIERIKALREKVILVSWDYTSGPAPLNTVRFDGWRCSKQWIENPESADGVALYEERTWFEDWSPEIKKLIKNYQKSSVHIEPLFQAGIWKDLGFTVFGGCGVGVSSEGGTMPWYHQRMANIDQWKVSVEKWKLDGLIFTVWGRAGGCMPPNVIFDLRWPLLAYGTGTAFFEGIPNEQFLKLLHKIGRCHENWSIENWIREEVEALTPLVRSHHYEWTTFRLMVKVFAVQRSIKSLQWEMERYGCGNRFMPSQWEKIHGRLQESQDKLRGQRKELLTHLDERYYGAGLEEWFEEIFDIPLAALEKMGQVMRQKQDIAKSRFGISS